MSVKAVSQYAIAGTPGGIHEDIVPDTLLRPIIPSTGNFFMDYFIDINRDGINDIKIRAYASVGVGGQFLNVNISSLDSSASFSMGSIDSSLHNPPSPCPGPWWRIRTILKMHSIGDTIKNDNYVFFGYLGFKWLSGAGTCMENQENSQWLNTGDVYLGVRYVTVSDTVYGWVKVNVADYYKVTVKEFSLGSPSSAGIHSIIDINNSIILFPNPATDQITISSDYNERFFKIEIKNIIGEVVKRINFISNGNKSTIEISLAELPKGLYFIQLNTDKGNIAKKFIKK